MVILEASLTPLHNPAGTVVDSDVINCAGPNQAILAFVVAAYLSP